MSDPVVEQIVSYVNTLSYENLSTHVVHQAKRRIVDTMACALGAYPSEPARIARALAPTVTDGQTASVFGSLARTTPEHAAFANGVMSRFLDFNDSSLGGNRGAHPSDNIAAVLAACEATQSPGRDFLLALTMCYEIQCRIADSVPLQDKGWDQPVAGGIAVAAACGRLMGLSSDQLRHAISLAVIPHFSSYQTRVGELSMWKACAGAHGARQGLLAATMASKGLTGPEQPFCGTHGLFALAVGKSYPIQPFTQRGDDFAIALSALKKHPVRTFGQLMVDTAMDLHDKVKASDVSSLRIRTFGASYKHKEIEDPATWAANTRETADHSLLFVIAVTLIDGRLTPDTYERERYLDQDVRELIRKSCIEIDATFDKEFEAGVRNCALEATTRAGPTVISHLRVTPADIKRGPSDADIEGKFERLSDRLMPAEQRRRLLDTLWNIDCAPSVGAVIDGTRITSG